MKSRIVKLKTLINIDYTQSMRNTSFPSNIYGPNIVLRLNPVHVPPHNKYNGD